MKGTRQQRKRASRHWKWNAVNEAKNRRAPRQMERAQRQLPSMPLCNSRPDVSFPPPDRLLDLRATIRAGTTPAAVAEAFSFPAVIFTLRVGASTSTADALTSAADNLT